MKRSKLSGFLLAGAMAVGSLAGTAAHASEHSHGHGHADTARMVVLNNGEKWATDQALRDSMTQIRASIDLNLPAIYDAKQAAPYEALGREIERQIANIVQNCKLEPAADEVLHAILAELIQGNDALQGKDPQTARIDGVKRVLQSLELYAEHFEHPGFEAPRIEH